MKSCGIMILVFAISLALVFPASAEILSWTEHSAVKVRPFDPPGQSASYHLYSAQNEWEAMQVVLAESGSGSLSGCDVSVSPLTGPGNDITGIDLYREHYVYIEHPSDKPLDPDVYGWWPDALVPFVDAYYGEDRDGAPFDVQAGWNQPIWIDFFIPTAQTAGDYTGAITVSCSGETDVEFPVTLTVWDFELPGAITLPSAYGYSCGSVYNTHVSLGGTPDRNQLSVLYYKEALKHRMMLAWGHCVGPTWTYDPSTETGTLDFTDFDAHMGELLDGTLISTGASFDSVRIPNQSRGDTEQIAYWQAYADHFSSNGWFEKLFLYLHDEPTPDEYPALAAEADLLHAANPGLRAMATEQIADGLIDHVDIWCPDEPLFSDSLPFGTRPEDYPPRQALGEEVWWYNCMSALFIADFSDHFVDSPGMSMRIWTWLTRRYNFDGILYWSSIYLYAASSDVWEDVYASRFMCNGDGTMFYPGSPSKIGGSSDIPVASIRMKLLREGMEDYEYFTLLDNMGHENFVQSEVERRAFRTFQWERNHNNLEYSRHRLASMILGTLDTDPPATPTGLVVAQDSFSLTLSWNASTEFDLQGYEISLARYTGERIVAAVVNDQTTSVIFDGLEPLKPHYLTLRTLDESENRSPWATEVSGAATGVTTKEGAVLSSGYQNEDDDTGDDDDNHQTGSNYNDDPSINSGQADDDSQGGCCG